MTEVLGNLTTIQLGVGVVVSAAIIIVVVDWRLAMAGLLVQYLLVSLLLDAVLPGGLELIKLVAGTTAGAILYYTARQLESHPDLRQVDQPASAQSLIYPMGLPFRLLALLFTSLALSTLPDRFAFAIFPREYFIPAFWLVALGLLTIILTRDPVKTGVGLLTFQNGFELLYSIIEPGLVVLGLMGIGTILVGFVASYLAVAHHMALIGDGQDEKVTDGLPDAQAFLLPPAPLDPDVHREQVRREGVLA